MNVLHKLFVISDIRVFFWGLNFGTNDASGGFVFREGSVGGGLCFYRGLLLLLKKKKQQ
jgi:hypothetical protein